MDRTRKDTRTPEQRFIDAANRLVIKRGGTPTAKLENGRIVFIYPDGTKTSGGQEVR